MIVLSGCCFIEVLIISSGARLLITFGVNTIWLQYVIASPNGFFCNIPNLVSPSMSLLADCLKWNGTGIGLYLTELKGASGFSLIFIGSPDIAGSSWYEHALNADDENASNSHFSSFSLFSWTGSKGMTLGRPGVAVLSGHCLPSLVQSPWQGPSSFWVAADLAVSEWCGKKLGIRPSSRQAVFDEAFYVFWNVNYLT